MLKIDKEFHKRPTKGVISMVDFIKTFGIMVGPKRVRRLLRKMGILLLLEPHKCPIDEVEQLY